MPTTWYVVRGGGAVATDASEPGGASVVSRLGEVCEAVSARAELVVFASSVGVSVVSRLGEVCEAVSTGGELIVFASSVGVSVAARLGEVCEAVSTDGELIVVASPVVRFGDVAIDRLFGCVTARITKASTTPVNSAIVPPKKCFAREGCAGSGGGTVVGRGGAPHEGQAVANELISLPQS
jgi:hypothetical protein